MALTGGRLVEFLSLFERFFTSKTRSVFKSAQLYIQGLFSHVRSNCSAIASLMSEKTTYQRLHHLINLSQWSYEELMDAVALKFKELISKHELQDDLCMAIDESGFSKKGKKSAGVARQYNGNVGKLDNCQVGVFGALIAGSLVSIIHGKLFKPDEGVSKIEHAKFIILHVIKKLKIKINYVNFDAFYGRDMGLLTCLDKEGIKFISDIPESHKIFLEPFKMKLPISKGTRGRKPEKLKPNKESISLREYIKSLKKQDFQQVTVRNSSTGKLKSKFHKKAVYLLNPDTLKMVKFSLLIRKDKDGTTYQALTNLDEKITLNKLAYFHSKRYFIERSFQDAKQALGMNQYECRSELAWSKHMTLCMLAQLFINFEKIKGLCEMNRYITAMDIKYMIAALLTCTKAYQKKVALKILDKSLNAKQKPHKMIYLRI